jgi:hypothetical protein
MHFNGVKLSLYPHHNKTNKQTEMMILMIDGVKYSYEDIKTYFEETHNGNIKYDYFYIFSQQGDKMTYEGRLTKEDWGMMIIKSSQVYFEAVSMIDRQRMATSNRTAGRKWKEKGKFSISDYNRWIRHNKLKEILNG